MLIDWPVLGLPKNGLMTGWLILKRSAAIIIRVRLLNSRTGISPTMTLERLGWSNAAFWV